MDMSCYGVTPILWATGAMSSTELNMAITKQQGDINGIKIYLAIKEMVQLLFIGPLTIHLPSPPC